MFQRSCGVNEKELSMKKIRLNFAVRTHPMSLTSLVRKTNRSQCFLTEIWANGSKRGLSRITLPQIVHRKRTSLSFRIFLLN